MHPICFEVFGRPIYWYGVMVATGYLAVVLYWSRVARREHRAEGFASSLGFWLMVSGIIGARLAYVLANLPEFARHPLDLIRIDQGGLVFYGGLLGGMAGFFLFARRQKASVFALGDFALSGLPLGHAFGRIGCLLNGCCHGPVCDPKWGVAVEGVFYLPVQLYEAVFNFALFGLLAWLYTRKNRDGIISAAYFLIYPVGRFVLEFWRGDERLRGASLTLAQITSLVLFVLGLLLLGAILRKTTAARTES